ncbi:type I-B CRISPR-associated protein Cas8b1/Cst1 [Soehngenia longivitae]|uniref:Type I-B CRISPR-associated protein Cas8b1/Cst1 n=1 Tax=Soehngenia longivitae TaxID=2562294 RepID=A0A4Z0D9K7_9FIRM|nr:type I-B CRISPR-associated protein Cas8b1/Cst1 [Soehngenia longivitae]TFZ41591.1 type I-B CRISPR-associated protein Cas8b1/Cst1 [Soehngenia longivitae]
MEEKITLHLEDWLYNAGIVGIYNILTYSDDTIVKGKDSITFHKEALNDFEEKYFSYFIDKYEKLIPWGKIVDFENTIKYYKQNDLHNLDKENLAKLNDQIDYIKKTLKSNSFTKMYPLLESENDLTELEKRLTKINVKKISNENHQPVLDAFETIEIIINELKKLKAKKYLAARNTIYNYINRSWNGVAFLNRNDKELDPYISYKNHFIDPIFDYLEKDKTKYDYSCATCNSPISNLDNSMSFMNNIGFDTGRKTSHVWNFFFDLGICPICKLVYSCVPAGFIFTSNKGIFVNANNDIENLTSINRKIEEEILKNSSNSTYSAFIKSINEEMIKSTMYEISDIQVIRLENDKYKFSLLNSNILNLIHKNKEQLNYLFGKYYVENENRHYLQEEVTGALLDNQNLYLLIHKLLSYKLGKNNNTSYSSKDIANVLVINFNYLRGLSSMEEWKSEIVDKAESQGYYLRAEYEAKSNENKITGISYRLLNALKTNNKNSFMDTVLNCYLYVGKQVPKIITEILKDDEAFRTIGYAFVTGLISGNHNNKNDNNKN